MRRKSKKTGGYVVFAVSGTNTISFAIDFREANTKGLLGFAVERINKATGDRKFMDGFKVFKSIIPNPDINTVVNTYSHPVQSFVWDDFSCYDNTEYEYLFYPLKGKPKNLDRSAKPILVEIKTEKLFSNGQHDIFFNRGVASSQAYRRKFFNLPPDKILDSTMRQEALDWLSRQLDEAIIKFIGNAKSGETLLGCFYEFRYLPVVSAFKKAIDNGVHVKIIIDAKENESVDSKGKFHKSFPKLDNLEALSKVGISSKETDGYIIKREARKNDIQHNKFMVLIDKNGKEKEVWTGSTNISLGGIHGQTNVGHWVRNAKVAKKFAAYWQLLSKDPGSRETDDKVAAKMKNSEFKKEVEKIQPNFEFKDWSDIPDGITPVFSPRNGLSVLESYVKMFDSAENMSCITLAFGINKLFKDYLEDNSSGDHISFMLLEKEDAPKKNSKQPFRHIGANQNVYKSWGAYIEDDLYRWAKETSPRIMKLNEHVAYIHSKFLLVDPLSNDPVVVTGSANFSEASTNDNDENMMIIRGDKRVADIYFTEFNRLFNHFYFRAVYKKAKEQNHVDEGSLKLQPNDSWLKKYKEGKFRHKRVMMFTKMEGF
ncbi:MAG TPA: phospholipase D-like domain-containing protein [Chitinophagaceae bacterium]|nr:phospholipase D-like domain-containing protein [Chitinophagaceae bacterium]